MFTLLTLLCGVYVAQAHLKANAVEWSFIKDRDYELVHIDPESIDETTKVIEFDAYDKHYKIELKRNDKLISPNFIHADPDYADTEFESCHYRGKVLNTDSHSVVSVSMCKYSGFVARITAFGDTILIKPSATFLDPEHHVKGHSLDEELIVYRKSYFPRTKAVAVDDASSSEPLENIHETLAEFGLSTSNGRKLLQFSSSNPAVVEVYVVVGPVRRANYVASYSSWWARLKEHTETMINDVSAIYEATAWSATYVGGIELTFKGWQVLSSFSGTAASLYPTFLTPARCSAPADTDACRVDLDDLLDEVTAWNLRTKENQLRHHLFDNLVFVTDMKFTGTATSATTGVAHKGTMCATNGKSSSVVGLAFSLEGMTGTFAHELGHNFGLSHDGQPGDASRCGANTGLMGYGTNDDSFSSCSRLTMSNFFLNNDLDCLNSETGSWVTNSLINSLPTQPASPSCITITGSRWSSQWNGEWQRSSDVNGKAAYRRTTSMRTWYIYFNSGLNNYYLFADANQATSSSVSFYERCGETNILSCTLWNGNIAACAGSGFEMDDLSCLDENEYQPRICLAANNSRLWSGDAEFEIVEDECQNENVIYRFDMGEQTELEPITSNDSETSAVLDTTSTQQTYFLHYTSARWVISTDLNAALIVAYCDEEDLGDCNGAWIAEMLNGDVVEFLLDSSIVMRNEACDGSTVDMSASTSPAAGGKVAILIVLALVFLGAVIIGCICFGRYRGQGFIDKQKVFEEQDVDQEEAEEHEQEHITVTAD